ncbi:ATP-binding cassette domain-containing protein [Blastococcus brunescens]|uniref:ATP-binding cassette domain-containing protein n=1 Tax=Blastococcus brunescens TaxID=1564165 RepID=A0ABZ1B357_9ACTN|nr:ATP-binding cassette domain-containing protein [Blastococcus sp. BMG 8361]WRL65233.1 ATP-binding cassette domain-containing protein [Blastococcus sp. BMG 8361]
MTAPHAAGADIRSDIPAVEVDDVSVRFGAINALSKVSFTVAPGSIHAIIGPNGAGKSTMFNVLSGVYKAAEGRSGSGTPGWTRCGRTRSPASGWPGRSRTSPSPAPSRWPRT